MTEEHISAEDNLEDLIRENTNISRNRKKRLISALELIDQISETCEAPKQLQDRAKDLFYKAFEDGFITRHHVQNGDSYETLAKVMFYIASTAEEDFVVLSKDYGLKGDRSAKRLIHLVQKELYYNKRLDEAFQASVGPGQRRPELYVREFGKKLDLDQVIIEEACQILEDLDKKHHMFIHISAGSKYAAALLYVAGGNIAGEDRRSHSGHPVTFKTLAEVSDTSEVTMRKYRNLIQSLQKEILDEEE